jgi:hypothetical protein
MSPSHTATQFLPFPGNTLTRSRRVTVLPFYSARFRAANKLKFLRLLPVTPCHPLLQYSESRHSLTPQHLTRMGWTGRAPAPKSSQSTRGLCQEKEQHDASHVRGTPEVRALCSAGITRPQRSYDPVRLPPWPPPVAMLRPLPSPLTGLPRLPEPPFRRAVPTTPADQAGAHVDCFPAHAAFPKWPEGRHPHCHFRGLLRLHSRYGSSDRSVTKATFVTRLRPCQLPAQAARQLPDQSTTLWVESSSTDGSRLRGARP